MRTVQFYTAWGDFFDGWGEMARLSVGWKGGIFESLQFVFNRRKVRRYFFLFTCELANAKRPARLRQAVVNSDGVQFQFLVTLCRINEDELPLGQLEEMSLDNQSH